MYTYIYVYIYTYIFLYHINIIIIYTYLFAIIIVMYECWIAVGQICAHCVLQIIMIIKIHQHSNTFALVTNPLGYAWLLNISSMHPDCSQLKQLTRQLIILYETIYGNVYDDICRGCSTVIAVDEGKKAANNTAIKIVFNVYNCAQSLFWPKNCVSQIEQTPIYIYIYIYLLRHVFSRES